MDINIRKHTHKNQSEMDTLGNTYTQKSGHNGQNY